MKAFGTYQLLHFFSSHGFYVLRSCICSAQTENRCNSKMVMRKVRILTLLCIHIVDTLNICINAFDTEKITLTKWQAKVNAESLYINFAVPYGPCQVSNSESFDCWFRRRFVKVFTIYGHGSHLGNMT